MKTECLHTKLNQPNFRVKGKRVGFKKELRDTQEFEEAC